MTAIHKTISDTTQYDPFWESSLFDIRQLVGRQVVINITINKDNLEKSVVELVNLPATEPPSLVDLSIKSLAEKVIDKTISLEQIKQNLPEEVFERIINYITEQTSQK